MTLTYVSQIHNTNPINSERVILTRYTALEHVVNLGLLSVLFWVIHQLILAGCCVSNYNFMRLIYNYLYKKK